MDWKDIDLDGLKTNRPELLTALQESLEKGDELKAIQEELKTLKAEKAAAGPPGGHCRRVEDRGPRPGQPAHCSEVFLEDLRTTADTALRKAKIDDRKALVSAAAGYPRAGHVPAIPSTAASSRNPRRPSDSAGHGPACATAGALCQVAQRETANEQEHDHGGVTRTHGRLRFHDNTSSNNPQETFTMASTARYRSGSTNPIAVKCDPNYPIEVGDLLFQDPVSRLAKPASAMKNQGSQALNQSTFHNLFLGVALQKNGAATRRSAAVEQHAQPQAAEHDRGGHRGRLRVRLRRQRLEHRRPGGHGEQHRRHGPAKSGRDAGHGRLVGDRPGGSRGGRDRHVANTSVGVRIRSSILAAGEQNEVSGSSSGAV